jgi:hypothetical protein
MLILLALLATAAADCYTDAPNMEDPSYTYVVSHELDKLGIYHIEPNGFDKFILGSGHALDIDKVLHLYSYDATAPMGVLFHFNSPWLHPAPPLDLSAPFQIRADGSYAELIQHDEVLVSFGMYIRMPLQIGWRNGTICLEYSELPEADVDPATEPEEPAKKQFTNYIIPYLNL